MPTFVLQPLQRVLLLAGTDAENPMRDNGVGVFPLTPLIPGWSVESHRWYQEARFRPRPSYLASTAIARERWPLRVHYDSCD